MGPLVPTRPRRAGWGDGFGGDPDGHTAKKGKIQKKNEQASGRGRCNEPATLVPGQPPISRGPGNRHMQTAGRWARHGCIGASFVPLARLVSVCLRIMILSPTHPRPNTRRTGGWGRGARRSTRDDARVRDPRWWFPASCLAAGNGMGPAAALPWAQKKTTLARLLGRCVAFAGSLSCSLGLSHPVAAGRWSIHPSGFSRDHRPPPYSANECCTP